MGLRLARGSCAMQPLATMPKSGLAPVPALVGALAVRWAVRCIGVVSPCVYVPWQGLQVWKPVMYVL